MDFYRGKFALVTGGSSGIGYALAVALVKQGCHVAVLARRMEIIEKAVSELNKFRISPDQVITYVQADVSAREEVTQKLNDYVLQHGAPDIVINSAGVAHPGTFSALKPEIFDWMMDVNYFGTVNVLKALVPGMKQNKRGVIVNISSIAGFIGVYGYTAYGASKFAVSGLSDALRAELKPFGIQVSIAFPPDTDTPQLEYESKFKPSITKEIAGSANLMPANQVANEILNRVARRKYLILPGTEGKLLYFGKNFLGGLLYPIMDSMVNSAIHKLTSRK